MRRLLPVLPLAVGMIAGAVLGLAAPDVRILMAASPAVLVAELGLLVTVVLVAAALLRRRSRRREAAAATAARSRADEAHRRFVGRLDHELKNPLTALLAALAGEAGPLPEPERALAGTQADRIRRLLTDLRRVADAEVVELDLERVEVEAVLREAVDLAVDDAGGARSVRVEVPTAPWPLPAVRADADLLLVAVYNVVANALKYTGPADVVEVRAREADGPAPAVTVEVADTGPGIPAEHHGAVWEELSRGAPPAGVPGSGIGLALVRAIVERHGGRAELRSRPGAGTSVLLHLPATR